MRQVTEAEIIKVVSRVQPPDRVLRNPYSTRVYFGVEGEGVLDRLMSRYAEPARLYRRLLPQVLERAGLPPDTKARWKRRAGCDMCGCSPGFVLEHRTTEAGALTVWAVVTLMPDAMTVEF